MPHSADPTHHPAGVTLDRAAHVLRVAWQDGHQSVYPLSALREACPCAVCRGGHEFMGPEHDPDLIELRPVRSYRVEELQLVGNYAMQIFWDDGHSAGIYAWPYLRRLCPCSICQAERAGSGQSQEDR